MNIELAKSLVTEGRTLARAKHKTIWFQNVGKVEEPNRSIDLIRKYAEAMRNSVFVVWSFPRVKTEPKLGGAKPTDSSTNIYGSYADPATLVQALRGVDNLYECLLGENPRFFYVDIDYPLDTIGMGDIGAVITAHISFICDHVRNVYKVSLDRDAIQIAFAAPTTRKRKGSAHLKFPVLLRNSRDSKDLADSIIKAILACSPTTPNLLYDQNGHRKTVMDPAVYSKTQNFRMLYSSKFGETRPLIPYGSSSTSVLDHLVGVYDCQAFSDYPVLDNIPDPDEGSGGGQVRRAKPQGTERHSKWPSDAGGIQTAPGAYEHAQVPLEQLEAFLDCLSDARMSEYKPWIQAMWAIYNVCVSSQYEREAHRLMHKYSKKCVNKYLEREVDNIRQASRYKFRGLHLGTIAFWAKMDNPGRYKLAANRFATGQVFRQAIRDNLYFDTSSLHPRMEVLRYNDRYVRDYDLSGYDIVAVKSGLNSGKTFQMGKLVASDLYPRVVVFSNRNLFGADIMRSLNQAVQAAHGPVCPWSRLFQSHLQFAGQIFPEPEDIPRLVIQMESVHKLQGHSYDLVILDESEAALTQFSSPTMRNLRGCAKEFFRICHETPKLVLCDGFLTMRTMNLAKEIMTVRDDTNRKCLVHVNDYMDMNKEAFQIQTLAEFTHAIIQVLEKKQRPVLFSSSKKVGREIAEEVRDHFTAAEQRINIRYYHADADDTEMLIEMEDVERSWTRVDFLLYSPIITNGVNFTATHFDAIFLHGAASSCCVSQVMQAARRVRNPKLNRIYFHLNSRYYGTEKTTWNYEVVAEELRANQKFLEDYFQYEKERLLSSEQIEQHAKLCFADEMIGLVTEDGTLACDFEKLTAKIGMLKETMGLLEKLESFPTWLTDVLVRNRIEVNLSRAFYEELFKDYLGRIGVRRIYQYNRDVHAAEATVGNQILGKPDGLCLGVDEVVTYEDIPIITPAQAERYVRAENEKRATSSAKLALKRYFFDRSVTVTEDNIQQRASVFDAIRDSGHKQHLFQLWLGESTTDVVQMVDKLVLGGNPFLATYPTHIRAIGAIQRLCRVLGLRHTFDESTSFGCHILLDKKHELDGLLQELYVLLNVRRQSRTGTQSDEVCVQRIRARLSAVLGAWNKGGLKTNSRSGLKRGSKLYTYHVQIRDDFARQAMALLYGET